MEGGQAHQRSLIDVQGNGYCGAALSSAPDFKTFFMGGFECAAHVRRDRKRLDLQAATRHDLRAAVDFRLLQEAGIRTVRDGLRWHRIEAGRGSYDWSTFLTLLRAAHDTGTEVIWDLCHWGVPDWLDPFTPEFLVYFERYARAAAEVMAEERLRAGVSSAVYLCPINEISFWSWVGGDEEHFGPFGRGRGPELKRQLVRATIGAVRAVREVLPQARFVQAEPLIHVAPATRRATTLTAVKRHNESQFEVWDMIAGRLQPELGGSEDLLDVLGVNYYWNNQWIHCGERTPLGHASHVPLHELLLRVQDRYARPLIVSETGAEGSAAAGWLGMVCAEVRQARSRGANVCGLCLYPVTDYPGWDDSRHVPSGLIQLDSRYQQRSLRVELVRELAAQSELIQKTKAAGSHLS